MPLFLLIVVFYILQQCAVKNANAPKLSAVGKIKFCIFTTLQIVEEAEERQNTKRVKTELT